MPAKSKPQFKFMQAMASGMKGKNSIGPSPEVAKEMISKTSKKDRKKFGK